MDARSWAENYKQIYLTLGPDVAAILATMDEEGRAIAAKMTQDLEGDAKETARR